MRIGVIGAGITGLSVTYELLRGGHEVRCYETGTPMAARSTGDTRIFRFAHQRPDLVEWAMRARPAWDDWSATAGERLVGDEGTVVSGEIESYAEAMAAAGAPHRITDDAPPVPAGTPEGPFLVDLGGGVVRAAATGRFLLGRVGDAVAESAVIALEPADDGVRVVSADGAESFDSVVVAAGAGTPALAAQVGIELSAELIHHARFTFPLREPDAVPPCWIDLSGAWRPGYTTYGHLAGPGRWAIGGYLGDDEVRWDRGREAVTEQSRQVLIGYVAEHVTGAVPEPDESVYCSVTPGLGDGLAVFRAGRVLALWGDNLFKFAPVLGADVAREAVS
jgi:sarcosine oxidase